MCRDLTYVLIFYSSSTFQRKYSLALADTGKLGDTKMACIAIRRSEEKFRDVGGVSMEMVAKLIPELGGHPNQICWYEILKLVIT